MLRHGDFPPKPMPKPIDLFDRSLADLRRPMRVILSEVTSLFYMLPHRLPDLLHLACVRVDEDETLGMKTVKKHALATVDRAAYLRCMLELLYVPSTQSLASWSGTLNARSESGPLPIRLSHKGLLMCTPLDGRVRVLVPV